MYRVQCDTCCSALGCVEPVSLLQATLAWAHDRAAADARKRDFRSSAVQVREHLVNAVVAGAHALEARGTIELAGQCRTLTCSVTSSVRDVEKMVRVLTLITRVLLVRPQLVATAVPLALLLRATRSQDKLAPRSLFQTVTLARL